jgi:sulfur carrier protein
MNVTVNGEERQLPDGATVGDVVSELDVRPERGGVAIAVNGEVVRRPEWAHTGLADGDRVEVLAAIQGG